MSTDQALEQTCIIIGASHAGVSAAFALRKEGWQGKIKLVDSDTALPYHRPPLSKAYLTEDSDKAPATLKPEASYQKNNIELIFGQKVCEINRNDMAVILENGEQLPYNKLIIAAGARPFIPPVTGIDTASNVFTLRNKSDVEQIRQAFSASSKKRVVVIGGGYIGLETAASLKKMGGDVTVLERETRLLARVTSPQMSEFFAQLHADHNVTIKTEQNVTAIEESNQELTVVCADHSQYPADIIIVGVGVRVNQEFAQAAGLTIENGIKVNEQCQTNDSNIYAIGDCAFHHNQHYDRWLRLESVQNAVDQSKVAAASICQKPTHYDALPWFWSDQYDIKLQMVGLATDYDNLILRKESDSDTDNAPLAKFSVWYFKGNTLLSVDAVNHAKAYVLGTKALKSNLIINKDNLENNEIDLTIDNLSL